MDKVLSIVTYAKKRRAQVEAFLPYHLARLPTLSEIVYVDYACPDGSGDFVAGLHDERVTIVEVKGAVWWQMNHARNLGGMHARGDVLVFADIDFYLTDDVLRELQTLEIGQFMVQNPRTTSLGFVALWREDYLLAQGYEEALVGYGYDDTQFWQLLLARGKQRRVMAAKVKPVETGGNTRVIAIGQRGRSASVNFRICRALRGLDPLHNNVGRNWAWGGEVRQASHLLKVAWEVK